MAGTLLWNLQTAVYAVLNGDATLGALVTGVYDEVPENTAYPYVAVETSSEVPHNYFGALGKEVTLRVFVLSDYLGAKEGLAIVDRVLVLLADVALTITGYTHVHTWHEDTAAIRIAADRVRETIIRFRVIAQEA